MSNQSARVFTKRDELPAPKASAGTTRHESTHRRHNLSRFGALWLVAAGVLCTNQAVMAQVVEGRFYRIKNVGTKKYLALGDDANAVEGAQIVQRTKGNAAREQWSVVEQGPFFKIINRQNGQALNVQGASTEEGAPIIQWKANVKGKNQRWTLEPHGAHFALKARHSDMVVDVADESKERKAAIVQNTFRNSPTQLFEFEPVQ